MGIPWDGTGINRYVMGMGQINMSHGQPWRLPWISGYSIKDGESTENLDVQYAKQTGIRIFEKYISIYRLLAPVDPISDEKVPNIIAQFT